jgi:HPt (histidine-containing phosphotransfer) domain-containing protein
MDDYLAKPIELPVLGEKVQRWLARTTSVEPAKPAPTVDGAAAFNPAAVERYFLGDPEFFAQSREVFVRSTPATLAELRQAVASGEDDAIRRICHRLKAASGALGGERLTALCERYEADDVPPALANDWLSTVDNAFEAFVRESNTVVAQSAA